MMVLNMTVKFACSRAICFGGFDFLIQHGRGKWETQDIKLMYSSKVQVN